MLACVKKQANINPNCRGRRPRRPAFKTILVTDFGTSRAPSPTNFICLLKFYAYLYQRLLDSMWFQWYNLIKDLRA